MQNQTTGEVIYTPPSSEQEILALMSNLERYINDDYEKELDSANSIITEFLSLVKNKKIDLEKSNLNTILLKLFLLIQADAVSVEKMLS